MSGLAHDWVKRSRLGSSTRKTVLLLMADYATDDAEQAGVDVPFGCSVCFAGIARIARELEMSRSTVKRVLRDMEAAGVIKREHRARTWGTGGRTSDFVWFNANQKHARVPADFHAPLVQLDAEHVDKCRRAGLASAAARRARREVRGHGEPGLGVTGNTGMGSPVTPQEPQFVSPEEPQRDHLADATTAGAGSAVDNPGLSSSLTSAAPSAPAPDGRLGWCGYCDGPDTRLLIDTDHPCPECHPDLARRLA